MQDDRWEYRIWPDPEAGMVERVVSLLGEQARREDRTDTYFLTLAEDVLAKIRGGVDFEVKRRLETHEGCERWIKEVRKPVGSSRRLDQMLGDQKETGAAQALLASLGRGIAIFEVQKRRRVFSVLEAEVEATTISIAGKRMDTLSLEAPQFELCHQLAERLGFKEHENLHYGVALRRIQ